MRAWDYPHDPVIISCVTCKRRGQYTKARFIEIVGRNTSLPDALRIIAKDCPKNTDPRGIGYDKCKAVYPDL